MSRDVPDPIGRYLSELSLLLPRRAHNRRRLLAEVADHLQMAADRDIQAGVTAAEARRRAVERFAEPQRMVRQLGYEPVRRGRRRGRRSAPPSEWSRRWGPLTAGPVAILVAVFVLPSALNVPQTNPNQTLEFAPVPPSGEEAPLPSAGNIGSLALGGDSGLPSAGSAPSGAQQVGPAGAGQLPAGAGLPPGELPDSEGRNPTAKKCVGRPAQQSADPMSPPCVAYFEGDNGGATYRGVTGRRIKVLLYERIPADGEEDVCGKYYDPSDRPSETPLTATLLRAVEAYERHFNQRYQTYGRTVEMTVYFGCQTTAEDRRADAAANLSEVDPFAVIDSTIGSSQEYQRAVADAGVMVFGLRQIVSRNFYREYPGLLWNYDPTIELLAAHLAGFACRKLVPYPASFGNATDRGQRRAFGVLYDEHPAFPEQKVLADLVKKQVQACGGEVAATATYGFGPPDASVAARNMAAFKEAGVTTILWTGRPGDLAHTRAAAAIAYTPEIVAVGQPGTDWSTNRNGQREDPSVWRNAWVVTTALPIGDMRAEPCADALYEADPEYPRDFLNYPCTILFPKFRQLFTGIQVSGPRLTPELVERGFRAIPPVPSGDPEVPACFYRPGEHTCVQDATVEWWDPQGRAVANNPGEGGPGCWRMTRGARRQLPGTWPRGDVPNLKSEADQCNAH